MHGRIEGGVHSAPRPEGARNEAAPPIPYSARASRRMGGRPVSEQLHYRGARRAAASVALTIPAMMTRLGHAQAPLVWSCCRARVDQLAGPAYYRNTARQTPSDCPMSLGDCPECSVSGSTGMCVLAACRKILSILLGRRYRPEHHYMRGPGPKWFERHGGSSVRVSHRTRSGHTDRHSSAMS
jgi:hypothetical protein